MSTMSIDMVDTSLTFIPLTLVLYDWLLTFHEEVEFIWRLRPIQKQIPFVLLRYGTLVFVTLAAMSVEPLSQHAIYIKAWNREIVMCIIVVAVHILLQLRIYVMYNRSRVILWVNAALFLAECAVTLYLTLDLSKRIKFTGTPAPVLADGCRTCSAFPRSYGYAYIAPMTFEAYLVALAVRQSWINREATRELGSSSTLDILVKGSVQYFALVAGGMAVSMIMFFADAKHALWVDLLTDATASIGSTRLILSVRKALLNTPVTQRTTEHGISFQRFEREEVDTYGNV